MTDTEDEPPTRTRAERRQDRSRTPRRRAGRRPAASDAPASAPEAAAPARTEVETDPAPPASVQPLDSQPRAANESVGLTRRERRELREAQARRKPARRRPEAVPPAVVADPHVDLVEHELAAPPPPAVAAPVMENPVIENPVIENPVIENPVIENPVTEPPAARVSAPPIGSRRARRLDAPAPGQARRSAPGGRTRRAPARPDRKFWTRVVPLIGVCLALLVAIGAVMRSSDDGGSPRRAAAVSPSGTPTKTLLLVHHSAAFGNDLIVLVGREQNRGSVLMVPGATQLDVPSLGVATLSAVPVDDNGAGLANSVENVVGVGIGKTAVLDDAGLTAVLGPAAAVPVTLTNPVEIVGSATKYGAGAQRVSAAQASELMSGPQAVNELDRLVTAAAVIDGWLTRLQDASVAQRTLALSGDLAPMVAAATAQDGHRIDTLPVDSIATGGGERFGVRNAELERYVARSFSEDRLGTGNRRPRVEVLNGTGFLGVAQAVSEAIVPAGGKVTLTENVPGFGVPTTQIVYYKDSWRAGAQRLLDAMKCGSLRKASRDLGISDVTIVVGLDCPQYGVPGGNN
ncbi:MAG: LytR C-terminal domain-containing protein [Acidimicrobiia bacterium]